jgi:hypothetical protein
MSDADRIPAQCRPMTLADVALPRPAVSRPFVGCRRQGGCSTDSGYQANARAAGPTEYEHNLALAGGCGGVSAERGGRLLRLKQRRHGSRGPPQRYQRQRDQWAPRAAQAARQPNCSITCWTQGEGAADGQAAPALEPVGPEPATGPSSQDTHAAAPHQHAQGELEVPGLRRQRREQQPGGHQGNAQLRHCFHLRAGSRSPDGKAKGKCPGSDAAIPVEVLQDPVETAGKKPCAG